MARSRGKEKFKADEARSAILLAGEEILAEKGVAPGLDRVTLREAIVRSGVPRTTAYRVFDGEAGPLQTFRAELLTHIDTPVDEVQSFEQVGNLLAAGESVFASGDSAAMADLLQEMIRVGFNERIESLIGEVRWRAYVSTVAATDTFGAQAADAGERFVSLFELVGGWFGIRPVPPLTWSEFANIAVSFTDGAGLRLIEDERFRSFLLPHQQGAHDRPWNGASVLALALFLVWCEPDPDASASADLSRWTAFARQ